MERLGPLPEDADPARKVRCAQCDAGAGHDGAHGGPGEVRCEVEDGAQLPEGMEPAADDMEEHNREGVVERRLPEDAIPKGQRRRRDLSEDREGGDGVRRRDERGKEKAVADVKLLHEDAESGAGKEHRTCRARRNQRAGDGIEKDREDVIKEASLPHREARLKDNGREQAKVDPVVGGGADHNRYHLRSPSTDEACHPVASIQKHPEEHGTAAVREKGRRPPVQ